MMRLNSGNIGTKPPPLIIDQNPATLPSIDRNSITQMGKTRDYMITLLERIEFHKEIYHYNKEIISI
ncbi:hypothetical protein RclHR1_03470006 [Rhizophagus clarus]|uniref:Uncharacterized protein n=1 Tax=Rhizophagus clarus TaxID=94130 RepID=A0A2Z6RRZ1_9GLOM|nr:hypothetical protein RclHR1_03470006 [Rhizophagus clarus]GES77005.1 hypothetical protein RCL_e15479_RclHR1_03470006 [Rhizophagus clarus]